jgi:hypothetical protein
VGSVCERLSECVRGCQVNERMGESVVLINTASMEHVFLFYNLYITCNELRAFVKKFDLS